MIIGVGIDLVDVGRVRSSLERWGLRWAGKIFTEEEIKICGSGGDSAQRYAGRYAAKEAFFKAAPKISADQRFFPKHIEIKTLEDGAPALTPHGEMKEGLERLGKYSIHLSITHEKSMAAAVAVIEKI